MIMTALPLFIERDWSWSSSLNNLSLAEAVEQYALNGIPIIPLRVRGKLPIIPKDRGGHGSKDATTDLEQVRKWWTEYPGANIGIATGDEASFFAFDIDGEEGEKSLRQLEEMLGPLPRTATQTTGKGRHLLFLDPTGIAQSQGKIAAHLDIRSNGGYIVGAPSVHPSGRKYQWLNEAPVAAAPAWLRDLAAKSLRPTMQQSPASVVNLHPEVTAIAEGSRNASLASWAGTLRRKGLTLEEMLPILSDFNRRRCKPPLDEREVEGVAKSIANYSPTEKLPFNDYGNAQRFVALHGTDVRYTSYLGHWFVWTGTHWQQTHLDKIIVKAIEVTAAMELEVGDEEGGELRKHIRRSQNYSKLEAMLKTAKSLVVVDESKFDLDPYLLSVANGNLNLRTGELHPHRREDFITKYLGIPYDIRALAPRWEQFIREITQDDAKLAAFLQRITGYFLTGDISEQCAFIFHGHGANGKSTFIEVLQTLLGPNAAKTPMTTFLAPKGERIPTDLARLRGVRLVAAVEARRQDEFNAPLLKEMTGGDRIAARFLRKDYFEFNPQFKIVMSVNDMPRIEAGDEAMNRRLVVVPFNATFGADQQDKHLKETLKAELPGILRWAVKGCLDWQRDGLDKPAAVTDATGAYVDDIDLMGAFIKECCREDEDVRVSVNEFHAAFGNWLRDTHGLENFSKRAVGGLMAKRGYKSQSRQKQREYRGIAVKAEYARV
jgi:putative DNA primase/helicase